MTDQVVQTLDKLDNLTESGAKTALAWSSGRFSSWPTLGQLGHEIQGVQILEVGQLGHLEAVCVRSNTARQDALAEFPTCHASCSSRPATGPAAQRSLASRGSSTAGFCGRIPESYLSPTVAEAGRARACATPPAGRPLHSSGRRRRSQHGSADRHQRRGALRSRARDQHDRRPDGRGVHRCPVAALAVRAAWRVRDRLSPQSPDSRKPRPAAGPPPEAERTSAMPTPVLTLTELTIPPFPPHAGRSSRRRGGLCQPEQLGDSAVGLGDVAHQATPRPRLRPRPAGRCATTMAQNGRVQFVLVSASE